MVGEDAFLFLGQEVRDKTLQTYQGAEIPLYTYWDMDLGHSFSTGSYLFSQAYLAMSGDSFNCHSLQGFYWHLMYKTALCKNCLSSNVNRAEVRKPCSWVRCPDSLHFSHTLGISLSQ